jgi:hypothetical protein
MTLNHPLDMKRRNRHSERIVLQDCGCDRLGRTNDVTNGAKSVFKFNSKLFEKLNMFRFLTRKFQQLAHAVIVTAQLRTSMIQYEWQYEFFYKAKDTEVSIASDLIKNALLFLGEKRERLSLGQRLGHERSREIEPLVAADDILHAPMNAFRRRQGRLI